MNHPVLPPSAHPVGVMGAAPEQSPGDGSAVPLQVSSGGVGKTGLSECRGSPSCASSRLYGATSGLFFGGCCSSAHFAFAIAVYQRRL